jgi:hydroxyacylglutathione hydrolase
MLSLRPLPAFNDNYIWTLANPAGEALVVDPGDAGPVLAEAGTAQGQRAVWRAHRARKRGDPARARA